MRRHGMRFAALSIVVLTTVAGCGQDFAPPALEPTGVPAAPVGQVIDLEVSLPNLKIFTARFRGVDVVFTEAPSWGQPLPEAVLRCFERVAAEEAVPFLRFRPEGVEALRDPSLFADPAHLNERGAAVATGLLAEALGP